MGTGETAVETKPRLSVVAHIVNGRVPRYVIKCYHMNSSYFFCLLFLFVGHWRHLFSATSYPRNICKKWVRTNFVWGNSPFILPATTKQLSAPNFMRSERESIKWIDDSLLWREAFFFFLRRVVYVCLRNSSTFEVRDRCIDFAEHLGDQEFPGKQAGNESAHSDDVMTWRCN